jgi:hypothetical protein
VVRGGWVRAQSSVTSGYCILCWWGCQEVAAHTWFPPHSLAYAIITPVGNATLVVANVLTCNKHSQKLVSRAHSVHPQPGSLAYHILVVPSLQHLKVSEQKPDLKLCRQGTRDSPHSATTLHVDMHSKGVPYGIFLTNVYSGRTCSCPHRAANSTQHCPHSAANGCAPCALQGVGTGLSGVTVSSTSACALA